ncbi:MAG: 3-oxoacyl-ACP reductase FabG [Candidatus Wallbacteria bacterium]|nr:3-oxoacyl-ACP reductase FabG [Candidatus Wallbacteria bacterium]
MILKDKRAVITGGTGALGELICEVFAREGASFVFTYHQNEKKAQTIIENLKKYDCRVIPFKLSLLDSAAIREMAGMAEKELGGVDILVNNAGVTQVMPFPLIEEEDWDRIMDVNVKGYFLVTKEVVRGMIRRKSGSIVNIGSLAGHRLLEVPVHYAAAKAAISGFTLALSRELARYNIRVNNIVPGMLDSGIGKNVPEKQYQEYLKYCMAGRPGKPAEVAELVAFVASDKGSYVNSQNLFADGGI